MNILLTGGTGYIASHAAVVLAQAGHEITLFDNLSNSQKTVITCLEKILNQKVSFIQGDVRDTGLVSETIAKNQIDAVIHFAGLKSVAESVSNPLLYYANNVQGMISLLEAMQENSLKKIVFSSSATVYGEPQYLPYDEEHPLKPMNPYGQTKLQVENLLLDISQSDPSWSIACLRYFNPVGAHDSGLIGENPSGIPNNLMPYVSRVAIGQLPELSIFGNDYETKDGTGERDYIHVMDLAEGHIAAIEFLEKNFGWHAINLGAGQAQSVMDLVHGFERASGKHIARKFVDRRPGDLPVYFAKAERAQTLMGWKAKRTLDEMCESVWNFQRKCIEEVM
jgi:UDP-glucose 4-epimerase